MGVGRRVEWLRRGGTSGGVHTTILRRVGHRVGEEMWSGHLLPVRHTPRGQAEVYSGRDRVPHVILIDAHHKKDLGHISAHTRRLRENVRALLENYGEILKAAKVSLGCYGNQNSEFLLDRLRILQQVMNN